MNSCITLMKGFDPLQMLTTVAYFKICPYKLLSVKTAQTCILV